MTLRALPGVPSNRPRADVRSNVSITALERWDPTLRAAADDEEKDRTISVLDVIGEDWWTGAGFTAKRMAGALRALGKGPVTVAINSPGGDIFEGLAMYSMLREHPGEVTVKVLGLAASAASIIAMAGDKVEVSRAGFLMIHNCWTGAVGNRHDFRALADQLEPFDESMADVYAARTGAERKAMLKLMDGETWLGGSAAVEQGFADSLLASDDVAQGQNTAQAASVRRLEAVLRSSGMPSAEAKRLISEFKAGLRDAAGNSERDATPSGQPAATLQPLLSLKFPFPS